MRKRYIPLIPFLFTMLFSKVAFADKSIVFTGNPGETENLRFIYSAARSEQISSVFLKFNNYANEGISPKILKYKLFTSNDRSVCEKYNRENDGTILHLANTSPDKTFLYSNFLYFSHELSAGICVIAKPVDKVDGRFWVSKESYKFSVLDKKTNSMEHNLSLNQLWSTLKTKKPAYDLWQLDGMKRNLDQVDDIDLIRSIQAGGILQKSALHTVKKRYKIITNWKIKTYKAYTYRTLRPTSKKVIEAILNSRSLLSHNLSTRRLTVQALTASFQNIPKSGLRQIIASLELAIPHKANLNIRKWQQTVNKILDGNSGFSNGKKAIHDFLYLSFAAQLVSLLPDQRKNEFAIHFKGKFSELLLRNLGSHSHIEHIVARSEYGEDLILQLIDKTRNERKIIPVIQSRIQNLIHHLKHKSDKLNYEFSIRCKNDQPFFNNGFDNGVHDLCRNIEKSHNFSS